MKQVIILQGVSGSGKSTVIGKIAREMSEAYAVVSADHYFLRSDEETKLAKYVFDPSKLGEAHAECFREFLRHMTPVDRGNGFPKSERLIFVDNTNTSDWEISPYMLGAAAHGYLAKIVRITCRDLEKAAARNAHGVPLRVIQAQADRIEQFKNFQRWPLEIREGDI